MPTQSIGMAFAFALTFLGTASAATPTASPVPPPEDPAAVQFLAQTQTLEQSQDTGPLRRHLAEYSKKWGIRGGVDRLIMTEVRLGELLWRAACPIPEADGLCRSALPPAPKGKGLPACEGPQAWAFSRQQTRQAPLVQEAMEHLNKALTLYHSGDTEKQIPESGDPAARQQRIGALQLSVATAMLLQGDRGLEQQFGTPMPTELVFDPKRVQENKASIARFKAWVDQKSKLLGEAQKRYQAVYQLKQAAPMVAAAGRIGQLFQEFSEELDTARIPSPPRPPEGLSAGEWHETFRDAYCDQMYDTAQPLAAKAVEAFKLCVAKALALKQSGPLAQRCTAALEELGESPPVAAPTLAPGPEVPGSLSPDLIRDAVRGHLSEVQSCAETAGMANKALTGQVIVKWKITALGEVASASLESSTVNNPGAEQCLLTLLKTWTFPKPQGGYVTTRYPFELLAPKEDSAPSAEAAQIKGDLSKGLIRSRIRDHLNEVKLCYEKGGVKKNLEGRFMVKFLIAASGTVAAASTQSSTLKDPETEQCILTALKTWTFPKPHGGVVVVSYPFVLKFARD